LIVIVFSLHDTVSVWIEHLLVDLFARRIVLLVLVVFVRRVLLLLVDWPLDVAILQLLLVLRKDLWNQCLFDLILINLGRLNHFLTHD
jgi:hypothetical protein